MEQPKKADILAYQSKIITEFGDTSTEDITVNNQLVLKNQINDLKKTINDYQIKYNQKCVSLENYKSQNEDLLDKLNNQENIKKIKSLEIKVAKSEALKTELKFQINELEIQLSSSDSEMYTLCKETEKIKTRNQTLSDENIQLKQHLENILSLCPEISFDEHEKSYIRNEDTYDMVDDKL
jgi:chromosome segregation ATPase